MTFPDTTFTTGTTITSNWLNAVNDKCLETVSVKDFGAVGDGVTNDTAAIQAALDSGQSLYVPEGTYLIDGVSISDELLICGDTNSRFVHTGVSDAMFSINGYGYSVVMDRLIFDCNNTLFPISKKTQAINYLYTDPQPEAPCSLTVTNCTIQNVQRSGILYVVDSATFYSQSFCNIKDSKFINGRAGDITYSVAFVQIGGASNASVENNFFDSGIVDITTDYMGPAISISLFGTPTVNPYSRVSIIGNIINKCGRDDAGGGLGSINFYTSGEQLIITNNRITNSRSRCIDGKTDAKDVVLTGNIIINDVAVGNSGIAISSDVVLGQNRGNYIISNNVVDGAEDAIKVIGAIANPDPVQSVVISGNLIKNFTGSGIALQYLNNVIVNANAISAAASDIAVGIYASQPIYRTVISDNNIETTYRGIFLQNPNEFSENVISGNIVKLSLTTGRALILNSSVDAGRALIANNCITTVPGITAERGINTQNLLSKSLIIGNVVDGYTLPISNTGTTTNLTVVNNVT